MWLASHSVHRLGALLGEAGKHADAETLLLEVLTRDIALQGYDVFVAYRVSYKQS